MKLLDMRVPEPIANWYGGLAKREQRLVLLGLGVIVLLILYLAVISPLAAARTNLDQRLQARHSLLVYMNSVADRLQTAAAGNTAHPSGSVFSTVSAAARDAAIGNAVQRLEQADNGGVRITLAAVPFDALMQWLQDLAENQGIVVESANIQGAQAPGTVNVNLTLNARS